MWIIFSESHRCVSLNHQNTEYRQMTLTVVDPCQERRWEMVQ